MIKILLISFLITLASCSAKKHYDEIKDVVITGKIHNYDGENAKLEILFSIPGCKDTREAIYVNESGYFNYKLSSYIPLDAMILEKRTFANINFIYHPGDSIHLEFEAQKKQLALLKSVTFSGNQSKTNNDIIKFQILRESNNLGYGVINPEVTYRLNTNEFVVEMQKIKEKQIDLFKKFVKDCNPTIEAKTWASLFAIETYFYFLDDYGYEKRIEHPSQYFNYNESILPITINKMICWKFLNHRISKYRSANIESKFVIKYSSLMDKFNSGEMSPDSLFINFVVENSSDSLLNQLTIANFYVNQFEANITDGYQKNIKTIRTVVREPFIFNSLNSNYKQVNEFINQPEVLTNVILNKIEDTPIEETFNKILSLNKGKVIYMDCWATWCGPCKEAMPDSKKLMLKMRDKGVSFVYICIESEEKIWKKLLSEFDLSEGQHFLMNKQQSEFFRDIMKVGGVPCYFLINKKGQIVEQGFHLHPGEKTTEEKIVKLLNEK
jgi:thiol-disulfide isomerase/thioredoxin